MWCGLRDDVRVRVLSGGRLLVAVLMLTAGALMVRGAWAQSGALHTLTQSDDGATLTVSVGDCVELRLSSMFDWTVTVSDPTVLLRSPVPPAQGAQALWLAGAPGRAAISATGSFHCDPGRACIQLAAVFSATVMVGAGAASGGSVTYQAGWNLVGAPQGTALPVDAYAWNAASGDYQLVPAGASLEAGRGYWAYFAVPTMVALPAGAGGAVRVPAPAGGWVLVGNPFGRTSASVQGADMLLIWNAASGSYQATASLAPGQGAWALSAAGGTITIAAP